MFAVIISEKGGGSERHEFQQNEVTIGRVQGNDIILAKGNVSKRHTRLVLKDGRFIVVDLKSTNGTYVNGRKVTSPLVVKPGDKIYIGDFTLTVEGTAGTNTSVPARGTTSDPAPIAEPLHPSPPPPSPPPPPMVMPSSGPPPAPVLETPKPASHPASASSPLGPAHRTGADDAHKPAQAKTWEPPRRAETFDAMPRPPLGRPLTDVASRGAPTKHTSAYEAMALVIGDRTLRTVMLALSHELDVHDTSIEAMGEERRWAEVELKAERSIARLVADGQIEDVDPASLVAAAVREAVGLGVLESLLADERVREILVSSPSEVWVDYGQGPEQAPGGFSDARMLYTVVRRLAAKAGATLERGQAFHDFLLPEGAHVTVVLPPVVGSGPVLEIRRVHAGPSLDDLVASHALSAESRNLLVRALHGRRSIAVVGPAGSGVTTVVAALARAFPSGDRAVIVSAVADLRLERANTVTLAAGHGPSRPSLRELVAEAGRLRADRFVVDGLGGAELATALAQLCGRQGGDVLGVRARLGESSVDTLVRLMEREGVGQAQAKALVGDAIALIVEMDAEHGLRRVRRVVELRRGPDGSPMSTDAV